MAKTVPGLNVTGRFKESGVTIYLRNGKPVARTATSWQPKRRTRKQFIARQQMLHSTRLWAFLKYAGTPMFPALPTAYARFLSLMHRTEVVFLPQIGRLDGATLLLPEMPVSEGLLPTVKQHLGTVEGTAALITDLSLDSLRRGDKLLLYTLCQDINGTPSVRITRREVMPDEMTETPEGLALTGDGYGDEMKGWALVRVNGDRLHHGEWDMMKIKYKYNICHQAIFYRKKIFKKIGLYNLKYPLLADFDFNMRWFFDTNTKSNYIPINPLAELNNKRIVDK